MPISMRPITKPPLRVVPAEEGQSMAATVIAGRYVIQRLIASGGVGDVYLATQRDADGTESEVVVKLLSERWLHDPDAVARFGREAMRIRSLEHPNIVSMHDSGVDRGRPFMVMEYIPGETLGDYILRRGRLTLREFVPIAAQILKGIGHAHTQEMMIRDIKPSNIMLCDRDGRANFVKILDFGLAKFTRNETPITEGYVLGTAGYLAPEAIKGLPLTLAVDVYSIGVLFYHLLSGRVPFDDAENATILYKTINEKPRDLLDLLPLGHDVPQAVLDLVADCLEKDATKRPADATAVVERLIDADPSSYFRLPRVAETTDLGASRSDQTGLIDFSDSQRLRRASVSAVVEIQAGRRSVRGRLAMLGSVAVLTVLGVWVMSSRSPAQPTQRLLTPVRSLTADAATWHVAGASTALLGLEPVQVGKSEAPPTVSPPPAIPPIRSASSSIDDPPRPTRGRAARRKPFVPSAPPSIPEPAAPVELPSLDRAAAVEAPSAPPPTDRRRSVFLPAEPLGGRPEPLLRPDR